MNLAFLRSIGRSFSAPVQPILDDLDGFMDEHAPDFSSNEDMDEGTAFLCSALYQSDIELSPAEILEMLTEKVDALPKNHGLTEAGEREWSGKIMDFATSFAAQCEEGDFADGLMHDLYMSMEERFPNAKLTLPAFGLGS